MLKIANWRNPSLKFVFDKSYYSKLQTHHERSNYAGATIQKFVTANSNISNLLKISISTQVQTNIEQFTVILSEYIDNIITNTNYINYVKFLAVASTFMTNLPRVERYLNFADLICHFCFNKENKSEQQYFVTTLHFLFSQQKFCDKLIQNAQMQSLILSFLKGASNEITAYCEGILTPQLVISSMNTEDFKKGDQRTEICAEYFIPKLFEFTISQRAQISSVYALILFLAKLAFKICTKYQNDILELQSQKDNENENVDNRWLIEEFKSQNQTLIDKISQNEVFGNLNVCLKMKENAATIVEVYSYLLRCTSSNDNAINNRFSVINTRALNRFIQLYKETTVSTKKSILSFLLNFGILYQHPFCCNCCLPNQREHFPLEKFCVDDVLIDVECFDVYSRIIEKVISMKHPEVVERSFQKILLLIKPVSNSKLTSANYQYPSIFKWFSKVLLMEGISPKFFRDQSFFSDFIINSSNEAAISFIKIPEFYQVLSILIDEKRNFHRKHALFRKMIELAIFQPDIQTSLLSLLSENFGPDIFRFYLKNMEQPKIHDVFDPFLPLNTYDFRNLFILGNCFQIVLRQINSEVFLADLLKLICLIVNQTNDHFFDEWVIMQPKESPLFKLDSKLIRDYVIPPNSESPIYIPSLLPLINDYKYEGESIFNFYLIGRFSTPIFTKLELENPYFPLLYLYYVNSVEYIRPYSFANEEERTKMMKMLKEKLDFIVPCYEFFPHSTIGYLEITEIPVNSISFNIKFNKVTTDSICFMRFSGLALIFKSGKILIGNDSPFKVNADEWVKVTVKSKLFSRTEITVNDSSFTVSKSFQFECLGDNNGLTFISYIIDKNITINEMEDSSSIIKLRGSSAFVPIHSISDFFDNYHNFLEVIEFYADKDETRNISFLISLSEYIKPSNLYSFFVDIFQAILRNSSKINGDNTWIATLVNHINLIDDLLTRTYIFCSFLFDIETWTKLTIHQMKTLISYEIFQLDTCKLQNEVIFTNYNFLFSLIISHYFDSLTENSTENNDTSDNQDVNFSLRELFFSLWNLVASKLPNNKTDIIANDIVPYAFALKISSLDFPSEIQEFNVGKVIGDISLTDSIKTSIISLIFDLENEYKKLFFNLDQLMEIALTQEIEIAEKAFDKMRSICRFSNQSDIQFFSKNVTVLCKISQRFSLKLSTWIFFTEFLIKQQVESFPISVEQILISKLEYPKFLFIIYSMLVSLSRKIISIEDDKERSSLIELRKSAFDFIGSIISSTKIDDNLIFSKQSLFYIYELMAGGEYFDIDNWIIKSEDDLKPLFTDSKMAAHFVPKLYQSIPLFAPLFTKIYDSVLQENDLPDDYFELTKPFFQKLISISFRNEKYFFYILEIIFNVNNIKFIQDNLFYIMLYLMTSDLNSEMIDSLRKFFYILSIIRPEVYTQEFINLIFSKCINENYFNVVSTYISCNDNFTFKLQIDNNNDDGENDESEFDPFLRLLETFGPQFVRDNLCNAAFIAVKLIQKGCNDKRFNDYLNLFACSNGNSNSSSNNDSNSTSNLNIESDAPSNASLSESSVDANEKERKYSNPKISNDVNELNITPDTLQKFVGPTFAHLICTLHDYSKIIADKQLFENAMNEFKVIYRIIKSQKIDNEILHQFNVNVNINSNASNEQIATENENEIENKEEANSNSPKLNSNPVLSHLASTGLTTSSKVSKSTVKKFLGVTIREDQKSFAMYSLKIISQSLTYCYNANKFFFNEFNFKLRRKEFDASLKYYKYSMYQSQSMNTTAIKDDSFYDENQYLYVNDRQQYEHQVITKRNGRSYKISPFVSPFHIPTAVLPSNFSLVTPNGQKEKEKVDMNHDNTFIFFKPTVVYSLPLNNEYPSYIFNFSSLYNYPKNQLLHHFEKIYGKVESMMNCILIRLDLRIDSIIMKMNPKMYIILTDATVELNSSLINNISNSNNIFGTKGEIKLKDQINRDLCSDFLNGDYGRFSMFCGHFVLIISVDDIQLSTPYISLDNPNSAYVNSVTCGSFIIEFVSTPNSQEGGGIISSVIAASLSAVMSNNLDFPCNFSSFSSSSEGKKCLLSINESKNLWLSGEISDVEYLLRVNRAAQRSFCDLSSYPIMPRLLKDFNQSEFPFTFKKQKRIQQARQENKIISSSVPSFPTALESEKNQNDDNDNDSLLSKSASTPAMKKKEGKEIQNEDESSQEIQVDLSTSQSLNDSTSKSNNNELHSTDNGLLRDLNLPIQISTSNENDLDNFRRRSESQSFFYAENVSNPICVSGVAIRLSPFCRSLWYLNDGWDQGSRNFTSIQTFFAVNKKTNYEFPPEAFIGNTFINWNKFVLPNGEPLTIKEFPSWSVLYNSHGVTNKGNFNSEKDQSYSLDVPFKFAELQRFLIEMEKTREELHCWIDLNFGCKQSSFEDYNVYSPLSYIEEKPPENQRPWILQCGRVPLKIFESKHEKWQPKTDSINEKVEENQAATSSSSLNDSKQYKKPPQQPQNPSQNQIPLSADFESSKSIGTTETGSNLSLSQKDEVIKYVYRFDLQNVKFNHHSCANPADQHFMANAIQRIKLSRGYSLLINDQGITLMHTKSSFLSSSSSPKTEKIKSFDCSLLKTTWVDEVKVTRDLQYVSLSYFNNTVVVARIVYEGDSVPSKLRPIGQLKIKSESNKKRIGTSSVFSRHCAINTNHLICATGFENRIVVWSISNGRVLWEATFSHKKNDKKENGEIENGEISKPIKNRVITFADSDDRKVDEPDSDLLIGALEFDEVTDALFVGIGGTLYQMSISGIIIREIELGERITTISCFGFGFSFAERAVVVGQDNGTVKIITVHLEEEIQRINGHKQESENDEGFDACENYERYGQFEVEKEMKISSLPIYRIETNDFSYNISVYDMSCRFPEFLPKMSTE